MIQAMNRFNDQFRETTEERDERLRESRHRRTIETLWKLIEDLSPCLADEFDGYSDDGLKDVRRRTANALPLDRCPDWLRQYRDPPVVQS